MTTQPRHLSLREAFEDAMDDAQGELEHVLALTYEFQDRQLLNMVGGRPLDADFEPRKADLKRISAIAPVVIYDARKTTEASQVPHFMELLPVRMAPFSCHHPKAYLVVRSKAVHLLVGSMNLTASGMFSNREVFQHFTWDAARRQDLQVLAGFADLLADGYNAFHSESLQRIVAALRERIGRWGLPEKAGRHHLLISGYGGPSGLERLASLWRELLPGEQAEGAFVVSPFFDRSPGDTLAVALRKQFAGLRQLRVVTDAACLKTLAKAHFGGVASGQLHLIPAELDEAERARIRQANDGRSLDKLVILRKLHAKLLVLHGRDRALVYMGSANFTQKAWNGDNRELGIAWVLDGSAAKFIRALQDSLGADPEDRYPALGEHIEPPDDTEDDYLDLAGYPDFVERIELVAPTDERVCFVVHGSALEQLQRYEVRWGQESLSFSGGVSSPLQARSVFARLLGGRNLRFALRADPSRVFYLPFRHAPEVFAERELLLNESAEDWISFQLGHDQGVTLRPGESLPGDPADNEVEPGVPRELKDGRENNAAVRMQNYLHLFVQLEAAYRKRAEDVLKAPAEAQRSQWQASIERPLTTLVRVLERERKAGGSTPMQHVFKLGELSLLWKTLPRPPGVVGAALPELPQDIASSPVVQAYLDHCRRSNAN